MFDPSFVVPSAEAIYDADFWRRLSVWSSASHPALMGQSTYLTFVENYAEWYFKATRNHLQAYAPLIQRLASRVVEPWLGIDQHRGICAHLPSAYLVSDLRELLLGDLVARPLGPVDLATDATNWADLDAATCGACVEDDVRMLLNPDAPSICCGTERKNNDQIAVIPIPYADFCKYDKYSNHYVHDPVTDLWWSVDFANHGGTIFKTFRELNAELKHENDHDVTGAKIETKHKGSIGVSIGMSELQNCSFPQRHILGNAEEQ